METGFKVSAIFWVCWVITAIMDMFLSKEPSLLFFLGLIGFIILFILGYFLDKKEWGKWKENLSKK